MTNICVCVCVCVIPGYNGGAGTQTKGISLCCNNVIQMLHKLILGNTTVITRLILPGYRAGAGVQNRHGAKPHGKCILYD